MSHRNMVGWGFVLILGCQEYDLTGAPKDPLDPTESPVETTPPTTPPAGVPDIEVEPASLSFTASGIDCPEEAFLTLRNVGDGVLTVRDVTLSGDADYTVEDWPFGQLDPGAEVVLRADMVPVALGSSSATVAVVSDDPDEPQVDVPVVGETTAGGSVTDAFQQNGTGQVDVLWIIDNSGSMSEKQDNVASSISSFLDQFLALGLDYHMGVVTTDVVSATASGRLQGSPTFITSATADPEGTLGASIAVGDNGSGAESGFEAMELALTEPLLSGENSGFYRPSAFLSVIVLSDENEQSSESAQHYIDFLEGLKGDPALVSVSAIAGPTPLGCLNFCGFDLRDGTPGFKYADVQSHFGGVFGSVCQCDYSTSLDSIGWTSAWFLDRFVLSETPLSEASISVVVDGLAAYAWTYDPADNAVVFDAASVPEGLATIEISYDVGAACL